MSEHERGIAIKNTQAHLESLRGELGVINSKLSQTLIDKETAEKQLKEIKAAIVIAQDELTSLYKKKEDLEEDFLHREDNLAQKERELSDERTSFESYRIEELTAIDTRKQKLEDEIAQKEETLNLLNQKLPEIERIVRAAHDKLIALETSISEKSKELNEITEQVEQARKDGADMEAQLNKCINSKKAELKEIEDKIEEQGKKVGTEKIYLSEREAAVDKREKNFEIMYRRLEKQFQKMYPGKELKL